MTTARRILVALGALLVLPGCGDTVDRGPEPSTPNGTSSPAPTGDGAGVVAGVTGAADCDQLHLAVLAELDAVAAEARAALPDAGLEDVITGLVAPEGLPPELSFIERLQPARPYGGIAGEAAEARYDELGCSPDDEYPAIADHLGVRVDASDEAVRTALEPAAQDAGGAVTLALARRLLEGSATGADAEVLVSAMREAVDAQEAVRAETGSYTDRIEDLIAVGLPASYDEVDGEVFLMVLAADDDRYCMTAAGERGVAYVESSDGVPVVGSRPDPEDWCAATFGELP